GRSAANPDVANSTRRVVTRPTIAWRFFRPLLCVPQIPSSCLALAPGCPSVLEQLPDHLVRRVCVIRFVLFQQRFLRRFLVLGLLVPEDGERGIRRDQQSDRVEEVADVADDVLRAVGIAGDDDATGLAFEERWLVREDVVVDFIEPLDHALDFRGLTAQQVGVAKTTMSESSTFLRIPGQASPLPMSLQFPGKMS